MRPLASYTEDLNLASPKKTLLFDIHADGNDMDGKGSPGSVTTSASSNTGGELKEMASTMAQMMKMQMETMKAMTEQAQHKCLQTPPPQPRRAQANADPPSGNPHGKKKAREVNLDQDMRTMPVGPNPGREANPIQGQPHQPEDEA